MSVGGCGGRGECGWQDLASPLPSDVPVSDVGEHGQEQEEAWKTRTGVQAEVADTAADAATADGGPGQTQGSPGTGEVRNAEAAPQETNAD